MEFADVDTVQHNTATRIYQNISSMMHSTLVLSSIIGAVAAKEWTITPGTSATTLVGVGAKSDTLDVAAACQSGTGNNAGAFVERFDGKTWVKEPVEGGMMMDSAVSSGVTVAGKLP